MRDSTPYFCLSSSAVIKWQLTCPLSKHCFLKHSALFWKNSLTLVYMLWMFGQHFFILRDSSLSTSPHKTHCGRSSLFLKVCMQPRERNSLLELSQNLWLAWVDLMTVVSGGEWVNSRCHVQNIRNSHWTESALNRERTEQRAHWTESALNRERTEQRVHWTESALNRQRRCTWPNQFL